MVKSKSDEIIEYRNLIMGQITNSKELIKLLGLLDEEYPEDIIPFNKAFPHEYVPETITKTDRFINFDMRADTDRRNETYKDITIWFFIMCHQSIVPYIENGRTYLWYDLVVRELDGIFTDKNILGVGETTLIGNSPYSPQQGFKGRLLTFKVKDFTNGAKYGKTKKLAEIR